MHTIQRAARAAALSLLIGALTGCAGTPSRTPSVPNAHKAMATPVSQSQLAAVVLTSADVPALQRNAASDHFGPVTLKYVADVGGFECTVLLNAINASTAYHALVEVDRGYQLKDSGNEIQIETQTTGYSSAAIAQRLVTDARNSAKGCGNLHYTLNGISLALRNVIGLPLPTVGDDSTAVQATLIIRNSTPMPVAVDTIRVGAAVLGVWVYGDSAPSALLQQTAEAAAARLRQAEATQAQ
jgi:hypothetical protein